MIDLKQHIEEALFSKKDADAGKLADNIDLELKCEDFIRRTSNTNWSPIPNDMIVKAGGVTVVRNGIKIDTVSKHYRGIYVYHISLPDRKFPNYQISEIFGSVHVDRCPNIRSLEGLFTKDCMVDGEIVIRHNDKLISLKGLPDNDNINYLMIDTNKNLDLVANLKFIPKVQKSLELVCNFWNELQTPEQDEKLLLLILRGLKYWPNNLRLVTKFNSKFNFGGVDYDQAAMKMFAKNNNIPFRF